MKKKQKKNIQNKKKDFKKSIMKNKGTRNF